MDNVVMNREYNQRGNERVKQCSQVTKSLVHHSSGLTLALKCCKIPLCLRAFVASTPIQH